MQLVFVVGVLVSYYARTYVTILAGRSIVSIYSGMAEWLIPMLQGELVPASIRGALVSFWMLEILFSALIGAFICQYTSGLPGDASGGSPSPSCSSSPAGAPVWLADSRIAAVVDPAGEI